MCVFYPVAADEVTGQTQAMTAHTPPHPVCPTCGQPAVEALADPDDGWECGNEACPEYGQAIERPTTD
jgi:ribosomal protein S27AE